MVDSLVLEQESDDGVKTLQRITRLLELNDSITRLRIEIESDGKIELSDLPQVEQQEAEPDKEPEPEQEEDEEPEDKPKFQSKDSHAYRLTKALADAEGGLHLDEIKDALGGPGEAPPNPSGNLYSLYDRGFIDKQKEKHPHRDRKLFKYYVTTKGEQAVEATGE